MLGIWVNAAAIIVGSILGLLLRGGVLDKFRMIITKGVGLCVMVIGISGAIKTENTMVVIVCVVVGSALGQWWNLEGKLDKFGKLVQRKFAKNDAMFSVGFVNATLLFCIGAMAVVGSMNAGLQNDASILLAKSVMDGVFSIILTSSMGMGVMFSAVPVTVYQGGIALLSGVLRPLLTDVIIAEMSATGSILIIGLSLNMLEPGKEHVPVGNMLPAIFLPMLYFSIAESVSGLF